MKKYSFLQESSYAKNVELFYNNCVKKGIDGKKRLLQTLESIKTNLSMDLNDYMRNKNMFTRSAVEADKGLIKAIQDFLARLS